MYNVWRTTVILIVTMYTEFVLYYTKYLIVLNKFNSKFEACESTVLTATCNWSERRCVLLFLLRFEN